MLAEGSRARLCLHSARPCDTKILFITYLNHVMIHTRVSFTDRLRREQKAVFNQGVVETVHLPVHVGFNVTVALIEIGAFLSVAGCSVLFSDSLCF